MTKDQIAWRTFEDLQLLKNHVARLICDHTRAGEKPDAVPVLHGCHQWLTSTRKVMEHKKILSFVNQA